MPANPPKWFYAAAVIALVWNLMGAAAFISHATISEEAIAALPEAERALYEAVPLWATIAFAVAVFGGALGSLFLLLRRKLAEPVLIASFAGILIQFVHSFFIAKSMDVYGPGSIVMPVMVIVIGAALVWFAQKAGKAGWLR
ncbi:MAG: hypothetical protein KDE05_04890 [Parvularculaceae bacterium]|nr:hypothetical protein [Parvularculaceae bacterium]